MTEQEIEKVINSFLDDFNAMCKANNRAVIIREYTVTYETGPRTITKRYEVTYQAKKKRKKWKVYAQSNTAWIIKKRFQLMSIVERKDGLALEGLYVKGIDSFPPTELKTRLNAYLENCKSIPRDTFVYV